MTRRSGVLRTVGLDLVGPLLVLQLCRRNGVSDVWSLVIAAALPAVGVLIDLVRFRTLEVLGIVVLGGLSLAVLLALVFNDPKAVLLEGAAISAALGIACVVSLRLRRPLIFYFGQALYGGPHAVDGIEMDRNYDRYPEGRRFWRIVTTVWGATYLMRAAGQVVATYSFSTATALTITRTTSWLTTAILISWTYSWGMRLETELPDEASKPRMRDGGQQ